jgi:hypothetical protein
MYLHQIYRILADWCDRGSLLNYVYVWTLHIIIVYIIRCQPHTIIIPRTYMCKKSSKHRINRAPFSTISKSTRPQNHQNRHTNWIYLTVNSFTGQMLNNRNNYHPGDCNIIQYKIQLSPLMTKKMKRSFQNPMTRLNIVTSFIALLGEYTWLVKHEVRGVSGNIDMNRLPTWKRDGSE